MAPKINTYLFVVGSKEVNVIIISSCSAVGSWSLCSARSSAKFLPEVAEGLDVVVPAEGISVGLIRH
jgi:hypothetical protein